MNLEIQKDLVRAFKMLTILRFYQQQEKIILPYLLLHHLALNENQISVFNEARG